MDAQKNENLAFTAKGKKLYAIKLTKPSAPFTIEATDGWMTSQVKSVRLLGSDAKVSWGVTPKGLQITPPSDLGDGRFAWSFEIVTDAEQHPPNLIVSDGETASKNAKKGEAARQR